MSGSFKVLYAPSAKEDLFNISSYLIHELKAPQAAKNVTTKIRADVILNISFKILKHNAQPQPISAKKPTPSR